MTSRLLPSLLTVTLVLSVIDTAYAKQQTVVDSVQRPVHVSHEDVKIPFSLENRTIFLQVQVGGSRAYWFILDTGDKYALIDLAVAKALHLNLGPPVDVGGGGEKTVMGNMLSDSTVSLVGLKDFSQPLFLALWASSWLSTRLMAEASLQERDRGIR
jgi:hypothetical protein